MNSLFVRKGDTVLLLAGKNKGKSGKVLAVDPDSNRVVVEGWNVIVKHVKAKSAQATGGIQKMPGSINASNVQVICPSCDKATKIAAGTDNEGKKVRACKHCGASLDVKHKVERKAKKAKKDEVKAEEKAAKKSKAKDAPATEAKAEKPVKKTVKKTEAAAAETTAAEKKPAKKTVKKPVDENGDK